MAPREMHSGRDMFPSQLHLPGVMNMLSLHQPAAYCDHGLYDKPYPGNSLSDSDKDLPHPSVAFGVAPGRSWPLPSETPVSMPAIPPGNMVNYHVTMPPYAPGHPTLIETPKGWVYFHQRGVNPSPHWTQTPVTAPAPLLILSLPTLQPRKPAVSMTLHKPAPANRLSAWSAEAGVKFFTATDLVQLACVCVNNNVFVAPYGEVMKTWEKVSKYLDVPRIQHSVGVIWKKVDTLLKWQEVGLIILNMINTQCSCVVSRIHT